VDNAEEKKKGNSNSEEPMDLLEHCEALFPQVKIAYLTGDTGDRECVGKPWLSFLMLDEFLSSRGDKVVQRSL